MIIDIERSLRYDPVYALRLLVDIAIRALSPAVNDPTTAVRSIDEIEGVLRVAAYQPLGPVAFRRGPGTLVVPAPTWDDFCDLALPRSSTAVRTNPRSVDDSPHCWTTSSTTFRPSAGPPCSTIARCWPIMFRVSRPARSDDRP